MTYNFGILNCNVGISEILPRDRPFFLYHLVRKIPNRKYYRIEYFNWWRLSSASLKRFKCGILIIEPDLFMPSLGLCHRNSFHSFLGSIMGIIIDSVSVVFLNTEASFQTQPVRKLPSARLLTAVDASSVACFFSFSDPASAYLMESDFVSRCSTASASRSSFSWANLSRDNFCFDNFILWALSSGWLMFNIYIWFFFWMKWEISMILVF